MEMERLTERTHGSIADELVEEMGNPIDCVFVKDEHDTCAGICDRNAYCDDCPLNKAIRKLADYEDAEEQGLLLRLPCKVGDTVYVLKFEGVWRIIPHQVKTLGYIVQLIENEAIGDFVFLTDEEAEQALAEMQKE